MSSASRYDHQWVSGAFRSVASMVWSHCRPRHGFAARKGEDANPGPEHRPRVRTILDAVKAAAEIALDCRSVVLYTIPPHAIVARERPMAHTGHEKTELLARVRR